MRKIACILAVSTGLGLVYCFSSAQEAGKKGQESESLELKLQQLRKARLEENEKQLKQMVLNYYSRPKTDDDFQASAYTPGIVELAKDRLRAILEATEQGKKRKDLLVSFLALVKETERKYKMASKDGNRECLYRALILETEIELVKAEIAASRK